MLVEFHLPIFLPKSFLFYVTPTKWLKSMSNLIQ